MISTRSSWLPGSERGWRSRNHKRHSSGDYKNPPPKSEHAGLREWVQQRAAPVVDIPWALRARLGTELIRQFLTRGYRVLCCSISKRHAHLLSELPIDPSRAKRIVGLCKGASSHAIKAVLPGSIWAEGGKYDRITDPQHHANTFDYILYAQGASAFTWSFKDKTFEFVSNRKRPAGHRRTRARVV